MATVVFLSDSVLNWYKLNKVHVSLIFKRDTPRLARVFISAKVIALRETVFHWMTLMMMTNISDFLTDF